MFVVSAVRSATINACDKGGEWDLALAFRRMPFCEGGYPSSVASISACGEGEEWRLAVASGQSVNQANSLVRMNQSISQSVSLSSQSGQWWY